MNPLQRFQKPVAFFLRRLPARLAQILYYRFFRPLSGGCRELFSGASLRCATPVAMDLVPGDECHGAIAFTGIYELALTRLVVGEARRNGGLLVDVGANFGYYSLLWAGQDEACRALAFEASPRVFQGLVRNVEINGLSHRIDSRCCAVSNSEGVRKFHPGSGEETGCGRVSREGALEVLTTTLDHALAEISEVAVLKIDAEGHDYAILCGAENAFRRRIFRHVFWEASTDGLDEPDAHRFADISKASGYRCEPLDPRARGITIFHAWR